MVAKVLQREGTNGALAKWLLTIGAGVIVAGAVGAIAFPYNAIEKRVDNVEVKVNALDSKREDLTVQFREFKSELSTEVGYIKRGVDQINQRLQNQKD